MDDLYGAIDIGIGMFGLRGTAAAAAAIHGGESTTRNCFYICFDSGAPSFSRPEGRRSVTMLAPLENVRALLRRSIHRRASTSPSPPADLFSITKIWPANFREKCSDGDLLPLGASFLDSLVAPNSSRRQ